MADQPPNCSNTQFLNASCEITPEAKAALEKYITERVKPWKWAVGSLVTILGLATIASFTSSVISAHAAGVKVVAESFKDKQDDLTTKQKAYSDQHATATTQLASDTGRISQIVKDSDLKLAELKTRIGDLDKEAQIKFDKLPMDQQDAIKAVLLPSIRPLVKDEFARINERLGKVESTFSPFGNNITGMYRQIDINPMGKNRDDIYILHFGSVVYIISIWAENNTKSRFDVSVAYQIGKTRFISFDSRLTGPLNKVGILNYYENDPEHPEYGRHLKADDERSTPAIWLPHDKLEKK